MKDISIRSTMVLSILALIAIGLMTLVEFSKNEYTEPYFQEKLAAANLMENCIEYLKNTHFKDEVSVDNINDPNDTRIIGTRYSAITSGRGALPIKLSTVNPNFAALLVELFKEANLKKGDHIAIGATGSFPALNIAALSAAEVLGLDVSYIASVTSSSWGANDPEYTYLDMQSSLIKGGLLTNKIIASSIGANDDIGRTLSPEGRELVYKAIERNNIFFINGKSLAENISARMDIFDQYEKEKRKKIKLYINIGGGIASLGSTKNSNDLPSGLFKDIKLKLFPDKIGVMFEMASRNVPLINMKHIAYLLDKYNLPLDPVPLPSPGEGKLFYDLKYDLRYVFGATAFLVFIIVGIIIFDKKQNALGNKIVKKED
ncbi:MAG: poly-gamma-glutamate system protein [Bacteroidales bacterium]|nr:poly-gamma-glutamate system protein [Bacteroidales bacterium]